jgi:melanoma-associated antigen p97
MFDSMLNHKDLIFQDATVRLVEVKPEHQTYDSYLGAGFIRAMERHEGVDCVTGESDTIHTTSLCVIIACLTVLVTQ